MAGLTSGDVYELKDEFGGLLSVVELPTAPIEGQKPGTSGLRKKTRTFMQGHYLANFVQSIFNALPSSETKGSTLVVGGDGRFYTREAIQIIIKIAVANGVGRIWIGKAGASASLKSPRSVQCCRASNCAGLLSTPAVSAVIREREGGVAIGTYPSACSKMFRRPC
jgi:phosphoglucomutase